MKSQKFPEVLKRLRLNASLSQESLAEKAGLHRTYISQLERAERSPSLETAMRISEVLGIPFSEMARQLDQSRVK
jgi:transcriptional regulator with XRE-family HTH domain